MELGDQGVAAGELEAVQQDAGVWVPDLIFGERGDHQRDGDLNRLGIFERWEVEVGGAIPCSGLPDHLPGMVSFLHTVDIGVDIFDGFEQVLDGSCGSFPLLTVTPVQSIVEKTQRLID